MGKLLNLATLAAAAAGVAYYLEKKGILKVTNTVDENGSREIGVKFETPEKPLTETVKEDLKAAQDTVTEKANELVNAAKAKFEELKEEGEGLTEELDEKLEEVKEEVAAEVDEVEKDIDDLLKDLDNDELKL